MKSCKVERNFSKLFIKKLSHQKVIRVCNKPERNKKNTIEIS